MPCLTITAVQDLKRVCLDYVSRHLQMVIHTDGYRHMSRSCPNLQAELLQVIANTPNSAAPAAHGRDTHPHQRHAQHGRRLEDPAGEERRVRPRRME